MDDDRITAAREHVRTVIGLDLSDEEFDRAPDILTNLYRIAALRAGTPDM
ncbi:hypothetical protein ACWD4B_34065 [Streptomyces sp. NPDC002536]